MTATRGRGRESHLEMQDGEQFRKPTIPLASNTNSIRIETRECPPRAQYWTVFELRFRKPGFWSLGGAIPSVACVLPAMASLISVNPIPA